MELRVYWCIVRRRLWMIVTLVLVVLVGSLVWRSPRPAQFQAVQRFTVSLQPEPRTGEYYAYDHYYTWLASEYLVDDLAEVVGGATFAGEVEALLRSQGSPPSRPLAGALSASTKHRTLALRIVWDDPEELGRIADTTARALRERSAAFFGQLRGTETDIRAIDPPSITPIGPGLREQLDVPLRLLLALVAGVALTFLFHYLDDAVYNRADVEELGMAVLAELPPHPRRRRFFWQSPLP